MHRGDREQAIGDEWRPSRQHVEQRRPQCVDVGPRIDAAAGELLWRHVMRCA